MKKLDVSITDYLRKSKSNLHDGSIWSAIGS